MSPIGPNGSTNKAKVYRGVSLDNFHCSVIAVIKKINSTVIAMRPVQLA